MAAVNAVACGVCGAPGRFMGSVPACSQAHLAVQVGQATARPLGHRWQHPDGHWMVKVGRDHHLANGRGYARESRVRAEGMLGRRLLDTEEVVFRDGDVTNSADSNLVVVVRRVAREAW